MERPLTVHVIATSPDGTRSALATAQRLTAGLQSRIVVLVPRLTSSLSDDKLNCDPIVDGYRSLAANMGVDATVLSCVCRRLEDIASVMLSRSSVVVLGGRRHSMWVGAEGRLSRRLTAMGYPVVFAQIGAAAGQEPAGTSVG